MQRPLLLFLCISLAWTLACALAVAGAPERQLWARQLAVAASPAPAVVNVPQNPRAVTAAAGLWTPYTAAPGVVLPTSAVIPGVLASPSSSPAVVRPPSSSSAAVVPVSIATPSLASSSSAIVSTPSIKVSTRANRELSSASASMASSSAVLSSPSTTSPSSTLPSPLSSSASSSSSVLPTKSVTQQEQHSTSFLQPSNKLFPLAVVLFVAIGLIALLLILFGIKWLCHRKRFADPRDYHPDPWDFSRSLGRTQTRQSGNSDLMGSDKSFDEEEKSGAWSWVGPQHHETIQEQQRDNGMRPAPLPAPVPTSMGFVSQAYSAPTPSSSASTRAHQTHRRSTSSFAPLPLPIHSARPVLPPTPIAALTDPRSRQPQRVLSLPPASLRPGSPTPRGASRSPLPLPLPAYSHMAAQAPSPAPARQVLPPVPALQPSILVQQPIITRPLSQPQPHAPKESSGLRYLCASASEDGSASDSEDEDGDDDDDERPLGEIQAAARVKVQRPEVSVREGGAKVVRILG